MLSFIKRNINGAALSGAVFTLTNTLSGWQSSASSDAGGRLLFNYLQPGSYTLQESIAPDGYVFDPTIHTVTVDGSGAVLVDGVPAGSFAPVNTPVTPMPVSDPPVIGAVTAGDTTVSGTGVPGSTVNVIFADGEQASAPVQPDGTWVVAVPPGSMLNPGDTVTAYQDTPGHTISQPTVTVVNNVDDGRVLTGTVSPIAFAEWTYGPDFLAQHAATAELRSPGNCAVVASTSITPVGTTGTGTFTFKNVPSGNYILYLYRPGYLPRTLAVTATAGSGVTVVTPPDGNIFTLKGGDLVIDSNNIINAFDQSAMVADQGVAYGEPGYTPNADLNADGIVNDLDYDILISNYGARSSQYPGQAGCDMNPPPVFATEVSLQRFRRLV
ncbi:MAG: Ig-like domain-containing protein [Christensenellaceae bacterium]|jgi:hypothetical protein|nr:Ig-like domain-containing protein [Christensenellaceae bacterium]